MKNDISNNYCTEFMFLAVMVYMTFTHAFYFLNKT